MGRTIRGVQTFIRFVQGDFERTTLNLWRGGLPPFGCEAVVGPVNSVVTDIQSGAASRPNGGKPPRHRLLSELNADA